MFKTPVTQSSHEKHPSGMYVATLTQVIDLGTHTDKVFKDANDRPVVRHLVRLTFESTALMTDSRPFLVSKRYTLSSHEKASLRKDLESWYGKRFDNDALNAAGGFDLEKVLGRPAFLNISHTEDGQFANIESINPLPAGMAPPKATTEMFVFNIAEWDPHRLLSLSEKTREMIEASHECVQLRAGVKAAAAPVPAAITGAADEIPF